MDIYRDISCASSISTRKKKEKKNTGVGRCILAGDLCAENGRPQTYSCTYVIPLFCYSLGNKMYKYTADDYTVILHTHTRIVCLCCCIRYVGWRFPFEAFTATTFPKRLKVQGRSRKEDPVNESYFGSSICWRFAFYS